MLKGKAKKDFYRRHLFNKIEKKKKICFFLLENSKISENSKKKLRYRLDRVSKKGSQIRNTCLLTGRSRGVLSKYRVSRIQFKKLANTSGLFGISK